MNISKAQIAEVIMQTIVVFSIFKLLIERAENETTFLQKELKMILQSSNARTIQMQGQQHRIIPPSMDAHVILGALRFLISVISVQLSSMF